MQANYNNRSEVYFLRAECIPIVTNASALEQGATTYAQNNGLENTAYEFGEDNIGEFAKLTGYKTVNDEATTFRVYMYATEGNYISLYAGSPSRIFPRREMLEFFESLKLNVAASSSKTIANEDDYWTLRQCNLESRALDKILPITVDEYTELDGSTCAGDGEEIHFIYMYTVDVDLLGLFNQNSIDEIGNSALPTWCEDARLMELLTRVGKIIFMYHTSVPDTPVPEYIGETSFRNADCELQ